jgi:putative phosphoesterase
VELGKARPVLGEKRYNRNMIGIMADSHDNLTAVRLAVRLFNDAGCDLVVHAGDFVAPFAVLELRNLACPVRAVYGNCDGEKKGLAAAFEGMGVIAAAPLVFEHAGLRFLVSHVTVPVPSRKGAPACDVLIFGHTHKAEVWREGGVLVVNPGETGGWLHGKSTVALLDPTDLSVRGQVLTF